MDAEEIRFIAWVRKQPATRTFMTRNSGGCPMAAYYREVHKQDFSKLPHGVWIGRFILWFDLSGGEHSVKQTLAGVETWIASEMKGA